MTRRKSNVSPGAGKAAALKPRPDFPLTPHPTGRWCKKVKGVLHYFGPVSDPEAAEAEWNRVKENLEAGRKPRRKDDERVTVKQLCDAFVDSKHHRVQSGELTPRTWQLYYTTCERVISVFGRNRSVEDLRPEARWPEGRTTRADPVPAPSEELISLPGADRVAPAQQEGACL
jgi:hypothetical protein